MHSVSRRSTADVLAAIDEVLLGGSPRYTREELLGLTPVPESVARAMWRAMGFPDTRGARVFTDSDVEALNIVGDLIDAGLLDDDLAITIARALGQTTSRLADWQVEALGRALVDRGEVSADELEEMPDGAALDIVLDRAMRLLPAMQELLVHVWRRHVAAVMERRLAMVDDASASTATIGFADLVGFTRLARQLEDADLAIVVEEFEAVSTDVVVEHGAQVIKTVGDEVLFVVDSPQEAAAIAFALHDRCADYPGLPELRIGMATGSVLRRMGDVFGATVNLASRLTALARPGTTRVDAATALALSADAIVAIRQNAPRRVRGVGVIRSFEIGPASLTRAG